MGDVAPRSIRGWRSRWVCLCVLLLAGTQLPVVAANQPAVYPELPDIPGAADVSDLPLVEMPVRGSGDTLVILATGDGGWAPIDKTLTRYFNAANIAVLGWDMLHYFWTARTPDSAARDLARIIAHYLPAWRKTRVAVVGYSLGAEVAPFMLRRLPAALRARVDGLALLAPAKTTYFEFHVSNWLSIPSTARSYPVLPELAQLTVPHMLCVGVVDEADTLCPDVDRDRIRVEMLSGGHHFGEDYQRIANLIMDTLQLRQGAQHAPGTVIAPRP